MKLQSPPPEGIPELTRNRSHSPVGEFLLELVSRILDPLARGLDVVDRDTGMAKAFVRVLVAVVDAIAVVTLGAVVVSELDQALAIGPMRACRSRVGAVVGFERSVGCWLSCHVGLPRKYRLNLLSGKSSWRTAIHQLMHRPSRHGRTLGHAKELIEPAKKMGQLRKSPGSGVETHATDF